MQTSALKNRQPQQRGFSLIEVLIAMLVLAIGLLGMAQMQASGIRSTHGAYLRTQATLLTSDMLDSMRANLTAARAGSYDMNFGAGPPGADPIADNDLTAWLNNVGVLLPNGVAQITTVSGGAALIPSDVTVAIRWSRLRQNENAALGASTVFTVDTTL